MTTKIFPNPLSNDGVDKLNHKWMLLLMLGLALAAFIIPLHPFYNRDGDAHDSRAASSSSLTSAQTLNPVKIPYYKAVCWAPPHFTTAHILYSSAFCAGEYNAAIRGQGKRGVYWLLPHEPIPMASEDRGQIDPIATSKPYVEEETRYSDLQAFKERVRKLVSFEAPIALLLVAVCLGVSQFVWAFLAECFGSFNVGKTLEDVSCQSKSVTAANRQQAQEEIAESLSHAVTQSQHTMSCLYLFKKFLSLVFVLGLVIFLAHHSLPKVKVLQEDFDKLSTTDDAVLKVSDNGTNTNNGSDTTDKVTTDTDNSQKQVMKSSEDVFLCDFQIMKQNFQSITLQSFTLQCIPVRENEMGSEESSSSESSAASPASGSVTSSSATVKSLLEFESLMFHIAFALMIILLISNIFSFLAWTYKLTCGASRSSLGLQGNASMDLVFLVQMARVNASAQVARLLARGSFGVKV